MNDAELAAEHRECKEECVSVSCAYEYLQESNDFRFNNYLLTTRENHLKKQHLTVSLRLIGNTQTHCFNFTQKHFSFLESNVQSGCFTMFHSSLCPPLTSWLPARTKIHTHTRTVTLCVKSGVHGG